MTLTLGGQSVTVGDVQCDLFGQSVTVGDVQCDLFGFLLSAADQKVPIISRPDIWSVSSSVWLHGGKPREQCFVTYS